MATDTEQLVVALEARIKDFEKNFQKANRTANRNWSQIENRGRQASRRVEGDMTRMSRNVTVAMTRMRSAVVTGLGVFGVGIGASALQRSIRGTVSELSELSKQARDVGLTFEAIQELRFGFGQAGVAAGEFNRAMENFAQRIGQAIEGSGRLADVLERNGVALRDANGEIRPTLDLMRDYADVIAAASSEQEAMNLAAVAFGDRAGRRMVRALRDGSAGMDELMQLARDAGIVFREDLGPAVETVDDRFDKLTQQIGRFFKGAVLEAVVAMDQLLERFRSLENRSLIGPLQAEIHRLNAERDALNTLISEQRTGGVGAIATQTGMGKSAEAIIAGAQQRIAEIEARTSSLFNGIGEINQQQASRGGTGGAVTDPEDEPDSRRRSTIATREQRDAAEELIRTLERELSLVSATDAERMVANNLRMAGADATAKQRERIVALTEALLAEEEAAMRAGEAAQFFGDIAMDSFRSLAREIKTGNELLDSLIAKLIDAAAQALLFGQGPFASMFGTTGGGLFGGRGYASGGMVRGPGTGTSDSIPARLSNGEFVVNAKAAGRHRGLLEAVNANRLPGFANGGAVSAPALHGQTAGQLRIKFEVTDRAGVQIEQNGAARQNGAETIIPVMVRKITENMAADIAENGPLSRSIQTTFGVRRQTR